MIRMFVLSTIVLILVAAAAPGAARPPDASSIPFVITRLEITGALGSEHADFTAVYDVDVRREDEPLEIPLLRGSVAIRDFKVSSGDASLERRGDTVFAVLRGVGACRLDLRFSGSVGEEDLIWKTVRFAVVPAVVTAIGLEADGEDATVELKTGLTASVERGGGKTKLSGFLGGREDVILRWQAKVKEKRITPVVLCEGSHLAQISASMLSMRSRLAYEVPQGEASSLLVDIDPALTVVKVAGDNIRDWSLDEKDGRQLCRVELLKPITGRYILDVQSEMTIPSLPASIVIPIIRAAGVDRQSGTIALSPIETIVTLQESAQLSRINPGAFVSSLNWPKDTAAQLTAAFRYSQPDYTCRVNVESVSPEVAARIDTSAHIRERRIEATAIVMLDVQKAGIFAIEFDIPADFTASNVGGEGVEDWKVVETNGAPILKVVFARKIIGICTLTIPMERTYDSLPETIGIDGLRLRGVGEQKGDIGISAAEGIEIRAESSTSLRPIDTSSLQKRTGAEVLGFEERAPDWQLVLRARALAAHITADVFNLVTIGDGFLVGSVTINYTIDDAGTQDFVLKLPSDWRNVDITGVDIRRREEENGQWRVLLQERKLGRYTLLITYDQPFDPSQAVLAPGGLETVGTSRESGSVVLASGTQLEVVEAEGTKGLRRIDGRELSAQHLALIENPILRAYTYAQHPYVLRVKTTRYPVEQTLDAVVDRLKLVTVVSKPGRRETQATYFVKNNARDSLRVVLPEGAELWTVFVDGQAVKPETSGGTIVVPLRKAENPDEAFPVELTYIEQGGALRNFLATALRMAAPKSDLRTCFAEWDVYLPAWVAADSFAGTMKPGRSSQHSISSEFQQAGEILNTLFLEFKGLFIAFVVVAMLVWGFVRAIRRGRGRLVAELLTIVAIIAVLAGLLLPAINKASQRGRTSMALSNLRQVGAVLTLYSAEHNDTLPGSLDDLTGKYLSDASMLIDPRTGSRYSYYNAGAKRSELRHDTPLLVSEGDDGVNVLFADGSVRWLSPQDYRAGLPLKNLESPAGWSAGDESVRGAMVAASMQQEPIPAVAAAPDTAMAAGVLPIRIKLPTEGQVWRFSKVLDIDNEPLSIQARVVSKSRARNLALVFGFLYLLSGLFLMKLGGERASSTFNGLGLALIYLCAWVWFSAGRMLVFLLVLTPVLVFIVGAVGVIRFSLRRKGKPCVPPPMPPMSGGAATAGLILALMLAGAAVRAEEPIPPAPLSLQTTKAHYTGAVNENVATFDGRLEIEAVKGPGVWAQPPAYEPTEIILLKPGTALREVSVRGNGADVVAGPEGVKLVVSRPGSFTVTFQFITTVRGDSAGKELLVELPKAVSTVLNCAIDEKEATVEAPTAIDMRREFKGEQTLVEILLGEHTLAHLKWVPRVKRAGEIKVAASCVMANLIDVREGALRLYTSLRFEVTQGELRNVRVGLPDGLRLLRVTGDKVLNWELSGATNGQELVLDTKAPLQSEDVILLECEMTLPTLPAEPSVSVPFVQDMQRESGLLALLPAGELNVTPMGVVGLQQIDPGDFPILAMAPILPAERAATPVLAYRYRGGMAAMQLAVDRTVPEIEVVVSGLFRISEKDAVLSATLVYEVRNAGVFELRMGLPDGYEVEQVHAPGVKDWTEENVGTQRVLRVEFADKVVGGRRVLLRLREQWEEFKGRVRVPSVDPLDVAKRMGHIGVGLDFGITLASQESQGLTEIPVGEFLGETKGTLLAFKYREEGWSLAVTATLAQSWVQATGTHIVRLGEGLVRYETDFDYGIENAPVDRFLVILPTSAMNVRIDGANIRERSQTGAVWQVGLQSKARGSYRLHVAYDIRVAVGVTNVSMAVPQTEGAEREQGFLVICSPSTLHVEELRRSEQLLLPVDFRDLPAPTQAAVGEEARLSYRYLRSGVTLALGVQRYEAAQVLQANVEKARFMTVFSEDGQLMTQVSLTLRNNARQSLLLRLPEGSEVWSCFVAGEAVWPALKDGAYLLPLIQIGENEPAYEVELTYVRKDKPLTNGRRLGIEAPELDLPMQNVQWEVFLPEGYTYGRFGGTMTWREKEEATFREFAFDEYRLSMVNEMKDRKAEAKKMAVQAEQMAQQGDVVGARRQLNRAKTIAGKDKSVNDSFKRLEEAEAYASVVATGELDYSDAVQQAMNAKPSQASSQTGGHYVGRSGGWEGERRDREVKVAEEQARKIRDSQAVSVSKATPLRVSLPVRGVRYVFDQVLWVPNDPAVSITMKARPAFREGFFKSIFSILAALVLLAAFADGWMSRRRVQTGVAAFLLLVLYAFVIYL